jgi:serine/threonine protein kinase/WD40 repeat protein
MKVGDDLEMGSERAGYRVLSLIGRGGMSVVYLADDRRLQRRVALKLMARHLAADDTFQARFLHESQLAASIDHPNIVPVYEAGERDGLLFIAMRYVEGGDLKQRILRGPLEPNRAIGIAAQIASALDAAHARGLVHRDVKPSNVLLDPGMAPDGSDHVYLADFGLTKRLTEATGLGRGELTGTIDYVAPEQIAGDEVDGRADVYSLGCVLYECLVGEPPYPTGSDVAVVFAHLDADPPAPSERHAGVPPALDAVIATAMAKEPDRRYATCRDLARAALAVAVDEASRQLADAAFRAAAGRNDLTRVESELTSKVVDAQSIRERARSLTSTLTSPPATDVCPFKGLASFEPGDAPFYFGRERLTAELVARLVRSPLLVVVGPSGSGKSSVLGAGLIPALGDGVLAGSERWRRVLIRPGQHPMDELRRRLGSGAPDPLAEALDAVPPGERLVLAVDQLEELFVACRDEKERAQFVRVLTGAAADSLGRATVVAALRADYYGRVAAYPALAELLAANHVLVGPMQPSELRRAIELPAARSGVDVEPELTDSLIDDVDGQPGSLPLLSTALLELWQQRSGQNLTMASYERTGGVRGAVARLAEATYTRVRADQQPLVRSIMLRLVGDGDGDAPVRRRVALAELDLERNEATAAVVAVLADNRLVTVSQGSVEVAHEALLTEWPRLRDWIEEDGHGRQLRQHLSQAALEWESSGRDTAELYRGGRLTAALDWTADHDRELNELERQFVAESRDTADRETERTRRTNRRLRTLLVGVAVLLAAAVVVGVLAEIQRGRARDASDRAQSAAAQARSAETAQFAQRLGAHALVEEDLALSLLLARQAVAIDDTPQTRGYLLAALLRSPGAVGIMHVEGVPAVRAVAVSPDGTTVAVGGLSSIGSPASVLHRFDAGTFTPLGEPISTPDGVLSLAYSPGGEHLAVGGYSSVRLLDARTGEQVARAFASRPTQLTFSADGSLLAVIRSGDNNTSSVIVRNGATLEQIGEAIEPEGFIGSWQSQLWVDPAVAMTPDGRALLTTSVHGVLTWWDLATREQTRTVRIPEGYRALAITRDGGTVAIGLDDGIRFLDVATGTFEDARGVLEARPNRLEFSPDGTTIVSTGLDGAVTLWDVATLTPRETLRGHSETVWQPAFSPDGATLYTGAHDGTVIAWDVTENRRFERRFTFTHDRGLNSWPDTHPGIFSPDGQLLAVALKDDGVQLRGTDSLAPIGESLGPTGGEVTDLAFSPDGQRLAVYTGVYNGTVTVWDVESRSLLRGPIDTPGSFRGTLAAVLTPDGAPVLGRDRNASVVSSSRDGRLVAVQTGIATVEIWDVAQRSLVQTLQIPGDSPIGWAVALSADGRLLAAGGLAPTVWIWDVATGELALEIEQNVGIGVWSVEFSPDGSVLAVSGADGFASLWDVATGSPIGPRLGIGGREAMLDISADGRQLLMTHGDGTAVIWPFEPEAWAERACALANRTLTPEEWEEFLPGRPYEPACT